MKKRNLLKKAISLALVIVMVCALCPAAFAAKVVVSPQKLTLDGKSIYCEKYNIDGSNYFKLRDLAYILDGTGSRFSVGWDAASGVVSIETGKAYTPNGSELMGCEDKSSTAQPSAQTIKINGTVRKDLSVYNIGGSNFFKLRDLGTALGFDVGYDAATNTAQVVSKRLVSKGTYPNVAGYPIERGDIKLCKVYVDGRELECDGYVKKDHPGVLFTAALSLIYQVGGYGECAGGDHNGKRYECFCGSINGKLVFGALGVAGLTIDGELFGDLAPEKEEVYEGWLDYCCTTTFLEKTAGATVTFSKDGSAAYIELGEPVTEAASNIYTMRLDPFKNTAEVTNINDGTVTKLEVKKSGKGFGTEKQLCPNCDGSGVITQWDYRYNPATGGYSNVATHWPCGNCGGDGYIND